MARPGLTGHRKFRRLARSLGSPALARGCLELLWDSCYESGEEYVGTSDDIETLVGWTGEQGMLTRALVDAGAPEGAGFLEPVDGTNGFRVHDLWHHAPDYVAKRRKRELDRQQKADPADRRIGGDRRTAPFGAEKSELPTCQDGVDRTPSPSPSHSPSPKNASAEARSAPLPFLTFPTVGPDKTWQLSEAKVAEWAALYPGLDIKAEARKALAWATENVGRRKTAKGMAAFLVNWFTRAVDSGRGSRVPLPAATLGTVSDECPHTPKCANPGRWECIRKQQAEAQKQAVS